MGFYECIYECLCVDCGSSLDNFQGVDWMRICEKHQCIISNTFEYSLNRFIKKFKRRDTCIEKTNYDVEILDVVNVNVRGGKIKLVKMKTDLDCSQLDESKKITYSHMNFAESWELDTDGKYVIVLQFSYNDIIRKRYEGDEYYWNWRFHKLYKRELTPV